MDESIEELKGNDNCFDLGASIKTFYSCIVALLKFLIKLLLQH